jgi:tetratricopeptide (TPR) repeat protein
MKKLSTLLSIFLVCLNLPASASVSFRDTSKMVSDSAKNIASHPDSASSSTPVAIKERFTLYGFRHAPEIVDYSAINRHTDSAQMLDAAHLLDSINEVVKVNYRDSLQKLHMDSLHSPQYVRLIDSLKGRLKFMSLDSLKQQAKAGKYELLTGPIYTEIALRYMNYDTISNKKTRLNYQNEALSYIMKALHRYSKYNDTTGLRICFDNLTKVYFAQKKYAQAKWFILQSNTISRIKKDTSNIITSLVTLSAIKSDIKDYPLAMRDLNEALQLSVANHTPKVQSEVLRHFAMLYSRLRDYPKEELILKKRDSLEDSIRKDEYAKTLAKVNEQHTQQVRRLDSLQNKKKVYTYNIRKSYKGNSPRKVSLL